jgi:hypothetical protein
VRTLLLRARTHGNRTGGPDKRSEIHIVTGSKWLHGERDCASAESQQDKLEHPCCKVMRERRSRCERECSCHSARRATKRENVLGGHDRPFSLGWRDHGHYCDCSPLVPRACLDEPCPVLTILDSFTPAGSRLAATLTSVCASWYPPQHPRPRFASSGYLTFGGPACRATLLLVPTSRPFVLSTTRQPQTRLSCLLSHTTLWAYIKSSG